MFVNERLREQKKAGKNSECTFYRGDCLIKESVERERVDCMFVCLSLLVRN